MMGVTTLFGVALSGNTFAQDTAAPPTGSLREAVFSTGDAKALTWRRRFNPPLYGDEIRNALQEPDTSGSSQIHFERVDWRRWQVEVHVGTGTSAAPAGGKGALPPPGPVIPAGAPLAIPPDVAGYSRQVPSWYFGDGTVLFNETVGQATKSTITALDPILTSPIASWEGRSLGGRIERGLTQWVSADFEVEYGARHTFTNAVSTQLQSSSSSFETAWQASLNSIPIGAYVTSASEMNDNQGRQLFTVGNLIVSLPFRISPYAAIGGGLMTLVGGTSKATLGAVVAGHYSVMNGEVGSAELDAVNISVVPLETRAPTLSVGTGLKAIITEHLGARVDLRMYRYHDQNNTMLSASPTPATLWSNFLNTTDSQIVLYRPPTPGYSSLGGPGLSNVVTFAGDGTATEFVATAGVFWRF
jgi:hypothetical protein